jgi:hypothetical protein
MGFFECMRLPRIPLLCFLALGSAVIPAGAQDEKAANAPDRSITCEQVRVLEKDLTDEPKGMIFVEGAAFCPHLFSSFHPPSPLEETSAILYRALPPRDPPVTEVHDFTSQLWHLLQECGYDPEFPSGSHGVTPPGISIRLLQPEGKSLAELLRKSLVASHIENIRMEGPGNETESSPNKALLFISIGYQ